MKNDWISIENSLPPENEEVSVKVCVGPVSDDIILITRGRIVDNRWRIIDYHSGRYIYAGEGSWYSVNYFRRKQDGTRSW